VQEALTNTLKHGGPGASATVRLRYLPERVELVIEDDGAGQRGAGLVGGQPGAGRGLSGMRQRVQAFGGDVQSGPRSPSGWRVAAQLRLEEKAAT
jgi:signal transduction histidine kinase